MFFEHRTALYGALSNKHIACASALYIFYSLAGKSSKNEWTTRARSNRINYTGEIRVARRTGRISLSHSMCVNCHLLNMPAQFLTRSALARKQTRKFRVSVPEIAVINMTIAASKHENCELTLAKLGAHAWMVEKRFNYQLNTSSSSVSSRHQY